jgi:hypothetical protein
MKKYKNYLIGVGIGVVLHMWVSGKLGLNISKKNTEVIEK